MINSQVKDKSLFIFFNMNVYLQLIICLIVYTAITSSYQELEDNELCI